MRKGVFVFLIFNFFLSFVSIRGLPREAIRLLGGATAELFFIHSSLMAFALVFLSFWVWKDGEKIEKLNERIDRLTRKKEKN